MRKIPATMASQHPDNALAPYWDPKSDPFISAYQEIKEAFHCFKDLGVSEYMWDWEGKHADAAVIDRMFSDYLEYFSENQLGRDKFLTFRIPNIWEEKGYNLLVAMTAILAAEDFSIDLNFKQRPLFEVILPMTTRAEQLMRIQTLFEKLARFKNSDFTKKEPDNNDYLEIIPLVESVDSQLNVAQLLDSYVGLHQEHFGRRPEYIRTFLACSDAMLSSGFLAGIIGNKIALSRLYDFSESNKIPIFPIAGAGSLTFRGGLNPSTIDRFLKELPGVRTVTVQSAFRYDYPIDQVKQAIAKLETELSKTEPRIIAHESQEKLVEIAKSAEGIYKEILPALVADMEPVFKAFPKRRDRRQHIGLLAYGRDVSGAKLPRAITFTGGLYSIGVPPEFIGLGQILQNLDDKALEILNTNYASLASDLDQAGKYVNKENLKILARQNSAWEKVIHDIKTTEKILGIETGPRSSEEKSHYELAEKTLSYFEKPEQLTQLISQSAALRQSIG